jgi:hypothetical protein
MESLGDARHVVTLRLLIRAVLSVALGCFVWLSAAPARADEIPPYLLPPAYAVSGALLLVGSDACSGLPCTETIAFSFDLGYEFFGENSYLPYLTDFRANGSGALGSFTEGPFAGPSFLGAAGNYFAFFPTPDELTEIDVYVAQTSPSQFYAAPIAPTILDHADLYSCGDITCLTDFAPWLLPFWNGTSANGIFLGGPVVSTVRAIPEPSTLSLLVWGLLALGLGVASKKFQAFAR